ncbi:rieske domain protein [Mycobacterium kansasii]|uniref:Rieske domain protein n=1 Tax=Mycobacterium kansasii TaxID=1768 RepID=A0A1V3WTV3_MYCKA|nr:rieske domain protein [Mycobacterium kansasii]
MNEIPPGTHKLVPIGRHGVGVYNVNGTFYAIANYCPHQGGPLCSGRARGRTIVDESAPATRSWSAIWNSSTALGTNGVSSWQPGQRRSNRSGVFEPTRSGWWAMTSW